MRTTEDPADSVGKLVSSQQTLEGYHLPLAECLFGLYGVQSRALLGQQAAHDPHPFCALLDFSVVSSEPAPDLLGDVPGSVIPDEEPNFLAKSLELFGALRKESGRDGADGPTVYEPQPSVADLWQVEPVAGDGFGVGIVFGERLLDEAKGLALLEEAAQGIVSGRLWVSSEKGGT